MASPDAPTGGGGPWEPFRWPDKTVQALISELGRDFLLLSALCCAVGSHGSFFSGLGTSEMAWLVLGLALQAHGLPFGLHHGFSCENDPYCQDVLRRYTTGPIVGDIMSLLHLPRYDPGADFDEQLRVVMEAPFRTVFWCVRTLKYVQLCRPVTTSSGVPCQDHSMAGKREGLRGKRAHLLFAWLRLQLALLTPIIFLENVPQFCVDFLYEVMGDRYNIVVILCGPQHVGFRFARRERLYIALLRKGAVLILRDIHKVMNAVCRALQNSVVLSDMFLAQPQEVLAERNQCLQARGFVSGGCAPVFGSSTRLLLTPAEQERAKYYTDCWWQCCGKAPETEPNLVYFLGDNPDGGWLSWSGPSGTESNFALPVIRNGSKVRLLWIPSLHRFMTRREILACMGFPSYVQLAHTYRLPNTFSLSLAESNHIGNCNSSA